MHCTHVVLAGGWQCIHRHMIKTGGGEGGEPARRSAGMPFTSRQEPSQQFLLGSLQNNDSPSSMFSSEGSKAL